MKSLIVIAFVCGLLLASPAAASVARQAQGLFSRIADGTSYSMQVLVFGIRTETGEAPGNPHNAILNLADNAVEIDLRPDFSLDLNQLQLSLQPRFSGIYGDSGNDTASSLYQWLARWRATKSLFVSYGRENLQWGPAYLTSLSNPFFTDNGKENPKTEVATTDFARAVWVPSLSWSVSCIANTAAGSQSFPNREFTRRYAVKLDYTGSSDYGSLIIGSDTAGSRTLGGFYGRTLSDALLAYAEGAFYRHPSGLYAEPADNPFGLAMTSMENTGENWTGAFLAGGSYTLLTGPTLTAEYLYYGPGYNDIQAKHYFDLQERAAQASSTGGELAALGRGQLLAAADPGLRFLRRHYLMLQCVQNDIADVFALTMRLTRNLDDGSSRFTTIGEWHGGDHLRLFAVATVNSGDHRSEFMSIFDYQLMAGIEYDF